MPSRDMSKNCEPNAFDGYCQEHHIPVEKCWQQPGSPSRDEIREQLLDYFSGGAPSYRAANDAVRAQAERHVDAILPLIDQQIRDARKDEQELLQKRLKHRRYLPTEITQSPSHAWDEGHLEAIRTIESWSKERIAELSPKPQEREDDNE